MTTDLITAFEAVFGVTVDRDRPHVWDERHEALLAHAEAQIEERALAHHDEDALDRRAQDRVVEVFGG